MGPGEHFHGLAQFAAFFVAQGAMVAVYQGLPYPRNRLEPTQTPQFPGTAKKGPSTKVFISTPLVWDRTAGFAPPEAADSKIRDKGADAWPRHPAVVHQAVAVSMVANVIVLLNCEPWSYGAGRSSPYLLARANTHGDPTALPILLPMH